MNYYQYNFVSPLPLLALVKEELKVYLDSGAVDSAVWSLYIDKCLRKLSKGMLQITPTILHIENYTATLPEGFDSVREAWLTTDCTQDYQLPSAVYTESKTLSTTTMIRTDASVCEPCSDCRPGVIRSWYKTTNTVFFYHQQQYLLKPGNVQAQNACRQSPNLHCNSTDTFSISGDKFVTNFPTGTVYLLYYAKDYVDGYQLIPDNYRIQEYIEKFIKQKVFEQLSNQVVDETYNQIQQKAQFYKQEADEAFIMADIETKKETIYEKNRKIIREKHRLDKYNIH